MSNEKTSGISLLFAIIAVLLFSSCKDIIVDLSDSKSAQTCFAADDSCIIMDVGREDLESVQRIFQGKILYQEDGIPSCGFSDTVAIVFDRENTFCIAHDTCATVYWKEKDRHFDLSEWEMEKLHSILESYGFHFPCV